MTATTGINLSENKLEINLDTERVKIHRRLVYKVRVCARLCQKLSKCLTAKYSPKCEGDKISVEKIRSLMELYLQNLYG